MILSSKNSFSSIQLETNPLILSEDEKEDTSLLHSEPTQEQLQLTFSTYILQDIVSNLSIFFFPALFTNFFWRLMNLYTIAVSHDIGDVILLTTLEIATVVFVACFIIDSLRQISINAFAVQENKILGALKIYWISNGMLNAFHISFKFFLGCIFWTIGYEIIANDHQIYASRLDSSNSGTFARCFAAGCGTAFGFLLASQIIVFFEYYVLKIKAVESGCTECWLTTKQRGIFGLSFKGFWEGYIWALVGDANWYLLFNLDYGLTYNSSAFLDSLLLGVLSSVAFTFAGILASVCGYYYDKRSVISNFDTENNVQIHHSL